MRAQLQNRVVIESPFLALILNKSTALVSQPWIARVRLHWIMTLLCVHSCERLHIYFVVTVHSTLSNYGRLADDSPTCPHISGFAGALAILQQLSPVTDQHGRTTPTSHVKRREPRRSLWASRGSRCCSAPRRLQLLDQDR